MARPRLLQHPLSYAGAALTALSLVVFVFLLILHTVSGAAEAPYAGIIIFVATPVFLFLGLALVPAGMLLERRRRRRTGAASARPLPVIDLNDARHRTAALALVAGTILLAALSVFGGSQAYHLTESVEFCGAVCHTVMEPEYVTYQNSPHAKVACVECHVGPGADWYLRSKLQGTRQLAGVLLGDFPRPIPAHAADLRPARDTCEGCHWPNHFSGERRKSIVHFLPDEQNTPWRIELLVRVGGGNAGSPAEGIHWHMNLANRIEYVAADPERREIPWVRVTDRATGETVVYASTANALSEEELGAAEIRTMDCMDCHNRPAHRLRSPSEAVNMALATGRIDKNLPHVKRTAVELLSAEYGTTEQALEALRQGIVDFFRSEHPELAERKQAAIAGAVVELQAIYRGNAFPRMRARWDTYPSHAAHLIAPGCQRCHDGLHQSEDGRRIESACDTCHTLIAQGTPGTESWESSLEGLEFRHPEEIGDAWQAMPCSACHTGALP